MRWDPDQYLQFAAERGRPFDDLLARVPAADPAVVVDLGCGPGTLTRTLADRWPRARVARRRLVAGDGAAGGRGGDVGPPRLLGR